MKTYIHSLTYAGGSDLRIVMDKNTVQYNSTLPPAATSSQPGATEIPVGTVRGFFTAGNYQTDTITYTGLAVRTTYLIHT